jgi:hypothetical protein
VSSNTICCPYCNKKIERKDGSDPKTDKPEIFNCPFCGKIIKDGKKIWPEMTLGEKAGETASLSVAAFVAGLSACFFLLKGAVILGLILYIFFTKNTSEILANKSNVFILLSFFSICFIFATSFGVYRGELLINKSIKRYNEQHQHKPYKKKKIFALGIVIIIITVVLRVLVPYNKMMNELKPDSYSELIAAIITGETRKPFDYKVFERLSTFNDEMYLDAAIQRYITYINYDDPARLNVQSHEDMFIAGSLALYIVQFSEKKEVLKTTMGEKIDRFVALSDENLKKNLSLNQAFVYLYLQYFGLESLIIKRTQSFLDSGTKRQTDEGEVITWSEAKVDDIINYFSTIGEGMSENFYVLFRNGFDKNDNMQIYLGVKVFENIGSDNAELHDWLDIIAVRPSTLSKTTGTHEEPIIFATEVDITRKAIAGKKETPFQNVLKKTLQTALKDYLIPKIAILSGIGCGIITAILFITAIICGIIQLVYKTIQNTSSKPANQEKQFQHTILNASNETVYENEEKNASPSENIKSSQETSADSTNRSKRKITVNAFNTGIYKEDDKFQYSKIDEKIFARDKTTKLNYYVFKENKWSKIIRN